MHRRSWLCPSALRTLCRRAALAAALLAAPLAAPPGPLGAQSPSAGAPQPAAESRVEPFTGPGATRAQLTAALADAERRGDRAAAQELRTRLRDGDLSVGDRFEVTLTIDSTSQTEYQVLDSVRVEVPALGRVDLHGVLRSELQPTMQRFFERFYRNPTVRVRPLVRIGFLGAVQRPGYYSVRPDEPVADALARVAGGPAGNANLGKVEVKRDGRRVLDRDAYRRVAREGLTFDQVALRSGDEVVVPAERRSSRLQILRTVAIGLSVFLTIVGIIRAANNT